MQTHQDSIQLSQRCCAAFLPQPRAAVSDSLVFEGAFHFRLKGIALVRANFILSFFLFALAGFVLFFYFGGGRDAKEVSVFARPVWPGWLGN